MRLNLLLIVDVDLLVGEMMSFCYQDLRPDKVDTCDLLRDGVLHLDARVDLDKEDILVRINQKFNGAGIVVSHMVSDAEGVIVEGVFCFLTQLAARRHFHHLLKAPLDRAVALHEVNPVAVVVAKDLHLHVLGIIHVLFDEDLIAIKSVHGLIAR